MMEAKPMRVIPVINQKGGVGKTTVCRNLSKLLVEKGYRVLILDMDPQKNIDIYFGVSVDPMDTESITMNHVLRGLASLKSAIIHTDQGDIVRADTRMYGFNGNQLITMEDVPKYMDDPQGLYEHVMANYRRQMDPKTDDRHILQRELKTIENDYDYILVDTNPDLGFLTTLTLLSNTIVYLLIPAFAEESSRQSILALYNTIETIMANDLRQQIVISGILLSRYENNRISRKYVSYLTRMAEGMGTIVFKTKIPKSCLVQESMAFGQSIFSRKNKANIFDGYQEFCDEFIARMDEIAED